MESQESWHYSQQPRKLSKPEPPVETYGTFDTENALRWFWYDGKGTSRLQMWCAQILGEYDVRGNIILPDVLLEDSWERYAGLPVTDRITALENLRSTLLEVDVWVGHNVFAFDYRQIQGEMLICGLDALPPLTMHDTLADMRKIRGQSRSMSNLDRLYPFEQNKEHVPPATWEAAFNDYDPGALKAIWSRNRTDVSKHAILHQDLERRGFLRKARRRG